MPRIYLSKIQDAQERHDLGKVQEPEPAPTNPDFPINWGHPTLEEFVVRNYWLNPEDAIGDIRLWIAKHRQSSGPAQATPSEPEHPTYGTLDELLAELAITIRRGELLRIGHHGALAWLAHRYAELHYKDHPEDNTRAHPC